MESKGTTRPWALQSHYNQGGWYVVWRYTIDRTKRMKPGKRVVIWRVDMAFLDKEDWKFRRTIVYQHPVVIRQGGPTLANGGK